MSNLDLSNPLDFARATLSGASTILQQFGRDPSEWDIVEAAYLADGAVLNSSNNASEEAYIKFHVFRSKSPYQAGLEKIQDAGGRRKSKVMFPYMDGQTTDVLGRKPETFTVNCLFHGPRYMEGFERLFAELNKPTPGTLIHPVRGRIKVAFEDHQVVHSHEKTQAVEVQLTFIEHTFSLAGPERKKDTGVKSALAKALEAFAKIDEILAKVEGAVIFVRTLKNNVETLLNAFKGNYAGTLTNLNLTYNPGTSVDIPGLLPVNDGGTGDDGSTVTTFPVSASPSDPFSSVPIDQIESDKASAALATETLKKEVNNRRDELNTIIQTISAGASGMGSLEFHQEILDLKVIGINLQEVLERGIASSRATVVDYTTPRVMSVREVAFANRLTPDRSTEIDLLNPELESVNFIDKGTKVKVPIS